MRQCEFKQQTPEWTIWRQGKIGASDAATISFKNPYNSPRQLWRQMLGLEDVFVNSRMSWGQSLEKDALNLYMEHTGIEMIHQPNTFISSQHDFLIASLDGISLDRDHAVEVKCGSSVYSKAKNGQIQDMYIWQMNHQMYVMEFDKIDFWVCDVKNGQITNQKPILIGCNRDEKIIKEMLDFEMMFYDCLQNLKSPEYLPPQEDL